MPGSRLSSQLANYLKIYSTPTPRWALSSTANENYSDELMFQAKSNKLESSLPGMPPQNVPLQPPPAPGQFDFMLKEPPKPERKFRLPGNLPRPAKLLIVTAVVLILVIILASVVGRGSTTNSQQLVDIMARDQEIVRVTKIVEQQLQDASSLAEAKTAEITLASNQARLSAYLKKNKISYSLKSLNLRLNKATDSQLQSAQQNNNLEATYLSYLKQSLSDYQNALQAAAKSSGKNALAILNDVYASNYTMLNSGLLKNS